MFQVKNKNDIITNYQSGARNFSQTILTAVNLSGINLEQINLDESNLIEINWSNCNLDRASFIAACLCLGNFQNCSLKEANLQQVNLELANMEGANLENANLSGANLQQANLKGANLKGANLSNIQLDGTCCLGAKYNHQTLFDPGFDPQAVGMILESTLISDNPATTDSSNKNSNTIQKIFSWCRSPKLKAQTEGNS